MRQTLLPCLLVVVALAAGCGSLSGGEKRATEIALREYEKHGGAGNVECHVFHTGGLWRVTIWTAPDKEGGYVIVEVSSSGKVLSYSPGY